MGPISPCGTSFGDEHIKILRRLLRARELGLPEGDVSTVEVQG